MILETIQVCPECGAEWHNGETCQDYFYQMLFWEAENTSYGDVHHLMVLCYHLQHPSLYSPEGLREAIQLLDDFLERGLTPEQVRKGHRSALNSNTRTWKITRTPTSYGAYNYPIAWTMTATSVIEGGKDNYCDSVRTWASSVHEAIKTSQSCDKDEK